MAKLHVKKCSVAQLCYIDMLTAGTVTRVGFHVTISMQALARHRIPAHWREVQLSTCVHTICTRGFASH
jgi:hypothetical protein